MKLLLHKKVSIMITLNIFKTFCQFNIYDILHAFQSVKNNWTSIHQRFVCGFNLQ